MSSTNRGAVRKANDFYATPERTVIQLLRRVGDRLSTYGTEWLEPCIGDGAIPRAVARYWAEHQSNVPPHFTGVDIDPQVEASPYIFKSNYLLWLPVQRHPVIISNPAFFLAQEIIEHSMNLYDDGYQPLIIMLLRLGFLGSKKRSSWWQGREPDAIYVLSDRPDFTGDGGDSSDYGWYFWNWHEKGIFILEGEEG